MHTYTFERVTYNYVKGWFATLRIDGKFAGIRFGKTRKLAVAAFNE